MTAKLAPIANGEKVRAMLTELDRDHWIELDEAAAEAITAALKRYAARTFIDSTYRRAWSGKAETDWRLKIAEHAGELAALLKREWPTSDRAFQLASKHFARHALRDDPFWFFDRTDFCRKLDIVRRAALKELPPANKGGSPGQTARHDLHVELVEIFLNSSEAYQDAAALKKDILEFTNALNSWFALALPNNRESIRAVCKKT